MRIKHGVLFVGALSSALLLSAAGNAFAATTQATGDVHSIVCETGTFYNESHSDRYIGNSSTRVYGASGGTLTITAGKSTTTSVDTGITAKIDAELVWLKVSASVSHTVGKSSNVTTTSGYSWKVPDSQGTGWLEMGAHGYNISWNKGYYRTPCIWVQTDSGTLLGTTSNVQFAHS
jgi:hypothetical protein